MLVFVLPVVVSVVMVTQNKITKNIKSDFVLVGGAIHAHLRTFTDLMKGRAVDFSSDGYIRDAAGEIVSGYPPARPVAAGRAGGGSSAAQKLSEHLISNKMVLDPSIIGISVVGLKGKVIASTDFEEIGADVFSENYFSEALKLPYKNAYVSDVAKRGVNGGEIAIAVSAPLISKDRAELLGVIVLYYSNKKLNEILLASVPTKIPYESFEIYLVNKESFLIASSNPKFYGEFLKKKIETSPVKNCVKNMKTAGIYENYAGRQVVGSVFCFHHNDWIEITEVEEEEVLGAVSKMRDLTVLFSFLSLLVGSLVFWLISRGISLSFNEIIRSILFFKEFKRPADISLEEPTNIKEIDFLAGEFRKMCFDIRDSLDLLSAEKNKLQAIFENAGEGIFVVDKEEKFKTLNKTAENLLGWTDKEIAGKTETEFLKILDDKKQPVHKDGGCLPNDVWKKGKSAAFNNFSFLKKNGERIVVDLSVAPIFDAAKKPAAGIFIFRDVSEFYKVEKVKSEFITVASHQLRTPLTATKWFLELALGEKPDKKMKSFLKNAYESNERIIALLADLLSAARLETSEIVPDSASADLAAAVKSAAGEQEGKIKDKKIKFSFKISGGKADDFKVRIDERFLKQAVANLLVNAIMYTPVGGKISITLGKKGNEALFAVKDTGYGIPKDEQKMIFQKFFRGTNVFKKETQGTGLGLYIVKAILEIFGGKIWFESEENKGTAFYFTLPLAR